MANTVNFVPLKDRVLLKRVDQEGKTPGGIIIPDTAKEKPVEGEVLAVGSGVRDEQGNLHPLEVKVGVQGKTHLLQNPKKRWPSLKKKSPSP